METGTSKKSAPSTAATLQSILQGSLNPFKSTNEKISANIIGSHDTTAVRQDVDPLFGIVSGIIRHAYAPVVGEHPDLKRASAIQFGEERVPDNSFKPTFCTLKEISSQMTCKTFDAPRAHETIVWILERLRGYQWDAKGVTVLAAFALDYGQFWHIANMFPTKANSLEVHTFKLAFRERPTDATANYNTLIDPAMQLIKGVIELEKLLNKTYAASKDARNVLSVLYNAPRDIYTYWAIFGLLACAGRMEADLVSELSRRLAVELSDFIRLWAEIETRIADYEDHKWRLEVLQTPSGILTFLIALIFPRDIPYPQINDNTTKSSVSADELRTKHLLLLISGLDHIDDEIWDLQPIHRLFMNDPRKSNYRIVWVPVVHEWTDERRMKFERLKSDMGWYIVEYFQLIKGYRAIQELWKYQEKPILVLVDPRGRVINYNALSMIRVWGVDAFPFTPQREDELSEEWGWFWTIVKGLSPSVNQSVSKWLQTDSYIFIYGGMDKARAIEFGTHVERIKGDEILKPQRGGVEADIVIEHLNLNDILKSTEDSNRFWDNISRTFQSRYESGTANHEELVLFDIELILVMKKQHAWALFSKGRKVKAVDYNPPIYETIAEFGNWRRDIHLKKGFDNAIMDYYHKKLSEEPYRRPYDMELTNLLSAFPHHVICPDSNCRLKMEIEYVNYKCHHGHQALVERQRDEGQVTVMKQ